MLELLDPKAQVTHNERIKDRCGQMRQFDVVVRGSVGGRPIFGVFECKDQRQRVTAPQVEGFVTKARDVFANLTQMVSKRGFTKGALAKARAHGVGALSLLPHDSLNPGLSVGIRWYVELMRWVSNRLTLFTRSGAPPIGAYNANEVTLGGKRIGDWWGQVLARAMEQSSPPERLSRLVRFRKPRLLTIGGRRRRIHGVQFDSTLERTLKTKQVQVTGVGVVDWNRGEIQTHGPLALDLPGIGSISLAWGGPAPRKTGSVSVNVGQWFKLAPGQSASWSPPALDISVWDDVQGEVPDERVRNLGTGFRVVEPPVDVRKRTINLLAL